MSGYKVYFFKHTESIFMLQDDLKDSTDDFIGLEQIEPLNENSSDVFTAAINSLKRDIGPKNISFEQDINYGASEKRLFTVIDENKSIHTLDRDIGPKNISFERDINYGTSEKRLFTVIDENKSIHTLDRDIGPKNISFERDINYGTSKKRLFTVIDENKSIHTLDRDIGPKNISFERDINYGASEKRLFTVIDENKSIHTLDRDIGPKNISFERDINYGASEKRLFPVIDGDRTIHSLKRDIGPKKVSFAQDINYGASEKHLFTVIDGNKSIHSLKRDVVPSNFSFEKVINYETVEKPLPPNIHPIDPQAWMNVTPIPSANAFTVVDGERSIHSMKKDICNGPNNSAKNIIHETAEENSQSASSDIYPINPQGITVTPINPTDAYQQIAELKMQLEQALDNNKKLEDQLNLETVEKEREKEQRRKLKMQLEQALDNNKKLEDQLNLEKAEKESEKEQRCKLEEKLRIEKKERKDEVNLRKKLEEKLRLQAEMKEERCRKLEDKLKLNENKFKGELALAKNECEVIHKEKKRCELEIKDVYMELGCLKKMVGERDRKMKEMEEEMKVLKCIKDGLELRIGNYKKERDADLEKLNGLLIQLKEMTKPILQRFRERPTKTHVKIEEAINVVNKRIGGYP